MLFACSGENSPDGGGPGGTDGGSTSDAGNTTASAFPAFWRTSGVESGNTGWYPSIAAAPDGTIGVAYLARSADRGNCTKSGAMNAPVARWNVMYASAPPGSDTFMPELIATVDLVSATAVSLAFDPLSRPSVAFMGGAETAFICGGTDLLLATKSGQGWDVITADANGTATPVFQEDADACARFQDTCNAAGADGVVGQWPALVFSGTDPVIAFRDTHFGFAQDDEEKSDLELWWNGARSTLDATWGGGIYTALAAGAGGTLYAAHANRFQTQFGDGIWVFRHDGAWSRQKVSDTLEVGPRLGLAVSGAKVGLVYHALGDQKLRYLEAADGTAWGNEETVDQSGNTGRSPSLAFSPDGLPAISYHYCGPFDPGGDDCPQGEDELRYALKEDGRWRYVTVEETRGGVEGEYTSLTFDAEGQPVIAYQAVFFDPSDGTVSRQLRVSRGVAR